MTPYVGIGMLRHPLRNVHVPIMPKGLSRDQAMRVPENSYILKHGCLLKKNPCFCSRLSFDWKHVLTPSFTSKVWRLIFSVCRPSET